MSTLAPLRRHRLAHLSATAWDEILDRPWRGAALDCLRHWSAQRLPLVVTRQPAGAKAGDPVALGLPAPLTWERRRIALNVPRAAIVRFGEFPRPTEVLRLLSPPAGAAMLELAERLRALGAQARVYGSYGWQLLSGQRYVHAESDIDLWIAVADAAQADAVAGCLASATLARPRLDGEVVFADGSAVAWREWAAWRAGRTRGLLVKRLCGPAVEHSFVPAGAPEASAAHDESVSGP